MRHAPFALISAISLLTVLLLASQAMAGKKDWVFDTNGIERINLELDAAAVRIKGTDGTLIRIAIEQTEFSERCETRVQQNGAKLEIESDIDAGPDGAVCKVRLELIVPRGVGVELESGAGNVRIDGLEARLQVELGAGDISGSVHAGELSIDSGAGNVELKVARTPIEVHTGAGDISLTLLNTPHGAVEASSGIGNVAIHLPEDVPVAADLSSGLGRVRNDLAQQASASARIEATTGVGNVTLDAGS